MKARTSQVLAQCAVTSFTRPGNAKPRSALSGVLLIGIVIGVLGVVGCAGVPAARERGATVSQGPPRPCYATPDSDVPENCTEQPESDRFAQELGIEPLGINLSAAGYMLDFRYRIVDAEKARAFTDRSVHPYLVDQTTGATLCVPNTPKVGRLRQTTREPRVGRVQFILFANPGRFIKPGSKVTLAFGEAEFKDLVVNEPIAPQPSATLQARELATLP